MPDCPQHRDLILDQFTRQAAPFSASPHIKDQVALRLIVEWSGAGPEDTVLDVACGAGHVVCAFARTVRHATGIDITPAMLERARILQGDLRLTNVTWRLGDVLPLPFTDGTFTLVTARYAFHHFPEPAAVLTEMTRVWYSWRHRDGGGHRGLARSRQSRRVQPRGAAPRPFAHARPAPVRTPRAVPLGGAARAAGDVVPT
jgi:SAM-dependent methyltransferase